MSEYEVPCRIKARTERPGNQIGRRARQTNVLCYRSILQHDRIIFVQLEHVKEVVNDALDNPFRRLDSIGDRELSNLLLDA